MRATEFLIDDEDDHYENMWFLLHENKLLLESSDNLNKFQSILTRILDVKDPRVGKFYSIMSLLAIPPGAILSIKGSPVPMELVTITEQWYEFNIDGVVKRYPEGQTIVGDSLKQTLLFNTEAELQKSRDLIHLSLVGWGIRDNLE